MVVLAVEVTGDGAAVRRRDPQVRAASVEDDLELLGRVADSNLREICVLSEEGTDEYAEPSHTLGVQEVADTDGVA